MGAPSDRNARHGGAPADPDRQIWADMLAHLRSHHAGFCRQWFEELEPLGVFGGALHLRAQSGVHRDYLRRQCTEPFTDAAQTASGRLLPVRFLGPDELPNGGAVPPPIVVRTSVAHDMGLNGKSSSSEPARPAQPIASDRTMRRGEGRHELVVSPDYCFENFVVGQGNRLAHAAALAVAQNPGRAYNPFFIHGGVGVGKTHLLQAIYIRLHEANPNLVPYYTSCEGFMTQFFESVQSGEMADFRHRFRDVDVLFIDDIHFLAKRETTQEEFFHTFNALYQTNTQIVLSSDAAPEEIPDLEERLISRFKWGLVARVDAPTYETRVEIVKTKTRLRGMEIPDDVACYIASRVDTNIRELEGAINTLHMRGTVDQRPFDMELARLALGEPVAGSGEPSIQFIIDAVTDYYGIRLTDLQSKHRQRSITIPRQVCMYLARRLTRHSLEEIGGYFGGRDHTTVMHAERVVEQRRTLDQDFNVVIKTLSEKARIPRPPAAG